MITLPDICMILLILSIAVTILSRILNMNLCGETKRDSMDCFYGWFMVCHILPLQDF